MILGNHSYYCCASNSTLRWASESSISFGHDKVSIIWCDSTTTRFAVNDNRSGSNQICTIVHSNKPWTSYTAITRRNFMTMVYLDSCKSMYCWTSTMGLDNKDDEEKQRLILCNGLLLILLVQSSSLRAARACNASVDIPFVKVLSWAFCLVLFH